MIFTNSIAIQLKQLLKADSIKNSDDLRASSAKMNEILDSAEALQVKNFIENQIDKSKSRLIKIGIRILEDYSKIEQEVCQQLDKAEAKKLLDSEGEYFNQYGFPESKQKRLKAACRELVVRESAIQLPMDAIGRIFINEGHKCYMSQDGTGITLSYQLSKIEEEKIENRVLTPNVKRWESEKHRYDKLVETQRQIIYIRRFRTGLGGNVDQVRLKLAIQDVCAYFISAIETERALRSLQINIIQYHYNRGENPRDAWIILTVNQQRSIRFEQIRARNIYILLSKPHTSIDIDDFEFTSSLLNKKHGHKNRYLHTEFNYINGEIAKGWYQYGFIYGANDLIRIPSQGDPCKHSYQVNMDVRHLIKKMS